jgi:uncharacterized membrane protein (UPF0136 family)
MNISGYAVVIYGIFVILGGLIGYFQARSKASLIAGGISGAILFISGILMLRGTVEAAYLALVVAIVLTGLFGKRFAGKRKFMPAGLMLGLSLLMVIVLMLRMFGPGS